LKTRFEAGRKPSELSGMMRIPSFGIAATAACAVVLFGCVGPKSYEQLAATNDSLVTANDRMVADAREAAQARVELEGRVTTLEKANARLERTASLAEMQSKDAQEELTRLRELNDALSEQGSAGVAALADENRKLLEGVMKQRAELQQQEDALRKLEVDLNQRSAELNERSQRVEELEALLSSRDAAADALRKRVADALLGFKDRGLTVEQRDGKVYVSLEAKLLFASGSTAVEPEGRKALEQLAKAVAGSEDLEIVVEGHTDTDALQSPSHPRNNWELSVLRATEVVGILTRSGANIDPERLTAAGRSEFHPVDPANKAKNRRIEIVLAPKLDALYELIRTE
jgi:chemotaxis protein MotB